MTVWQCSKVHRLITTFIVFFLSQHLVKPVICIRGSHAQSSVHWCRVVQLTAGNKIYNNIVIWSHEHDLRQRLVWPRRRAHLCSTSTIGPNQSTRKSGGKNLNQSDGWLKVWVSQLVSQSVSQAPVIGRMPTERETCEPSKTTMSTDVTTDLCGRWLQLRTHAHHAGAVAVTELAGRTCINTTTNYCKSSHDRTTVCCFYTTTVYCIWLIRQVEHQEQNCWKQGTTLVNNNTNASGTALLCRSRLDSNWSVLDWLRPLLPRYTCINSRRSRKYFWPRSHHRISVCHRRLASPTTSCRWPFALRPTHYSTPPIRSSRILHGFVLAILVWSYVRMYHTTNAFIVATVPRRLSQFQYRKQGTFF